MMEAVQTSETLVKLYHSTPRYNPEDSHLHTQRRENLKSYFLKYGSWEEEDVKRAPNVPRNADMGMNAVHVHMQYRKRQ
jgi:hypothetical protein